MRVLVDGEIRVVQVHEEEQLNGEPLDIKVTTVELGETVETAGKGVGTDSVRIRSNNFKVFNIHHSPHQESFRIKTSPSSQSELSGSHAPK